MKKFMFLVLISSLFVGLVNADTLTCQIVNIKEYDPPIHIDRKHMHEVWLVKYTCVVPGGKYRLYETLDTKNVYDIKKGDLVTWDVEMFGDRDVRGCIEDMQP
jgi:hypothetical protein